MKILKASWVIPVAAPPIENGAVLIKNDKIAAVGPAEQIEAAFPSVTTADFGASAILPGFVNTHAHLELTAMRGLLDRYDHDFSAWLLTLTRVRADELSEQEISAAATLGAVEGLRAGVTTFADIGRFGEHGLNALKVTGLRGIVYQETEFSPEDRTAETDFATLISRFETLERNSTPLVRVGLSPHAPYTVSPSLFRRIAKFAADHRVAITTHLAESAMEDDLIRHGTGFFTGVYEKFGVSWTSPQCSPVEYLDRLGVLAVKPLLAHCVRASERDLNLIARSGAAIAHCPKSNAKLGHGVAPLVEMLDAGIHVGLGSDSVASNNNCDLLEEGRFAALFARTRPGRFLKPEEIIRAATLGGAEALGMSQQIGSIEVGKEADLAVVSLAGAVHQPVHDPLATLVFSATARDVVATYVAGRELFVDGEVKTVDETELRSKLRRVILPPIA